MAFGRRGLHTKVVLAAGVAFLAFAHVRADFDTADAPAEDVDGEGDPMDGGAVDEDGNPIPPADEEPVDEEPVDEEQPFDEGTPAEPPVEEAPEDPPADEPMPEPEMEVSPPSLEKAPVDAELMALPTPYKAYKDVEYQPKNAPPEGTPVQDIEDGGVTVESATDCAQACIDEPMCNAATWMGANPEWTEERNCWLKTLGQTCEQPEFVEQFPNAFLLVAQEPGCPEVPGLPPNTGTAGAPAPGPTEDIVQPPSGTIAAPPPTGTGTGPVPPPPATDGPAIPPSPATGESGTQSRSAPAADGGSGAAGAFAGLAVAAVAVAAGAFVL